MAKIEITVARVDTKLPQRGVQYQNLQEWLISTGQGRATTDAELETFED